MNNTVGPSFVRDPVYFFEDGNCVLSVEGVLFHLHRTILRRNSDFFRNLFLLPRSKNAAADGESTDQPIICHDSIKAFRAWCSVLYSGFNDASIQELDEEKVAHVGLIAHKYQCDAIEMWARETIRERLQPGDDPSLGEKISDFRLEYLLGVATQCNWPLDIVTALETQILVKISEETPHHLRDVIRIADNVGSERLKAKAYYHFLHCHRWSLSPRERTEQNLVDFKISLTETSSQVWCNPLEFLTDYQKLRLHRGFVGLSALRGLLRKMPNVSTDCSCVAPLRKQWAKEANIVLSGDSLSGPKEFVEAVRKEIGVGYRHSGPCGRFELKDQVDNFLSNFDNNLVKFFPMHL